MDDKPFAMMENVNLFEDLYNGFGGGKGILLGVLAADVVFGGAELLGAGVDAAGVVVDGASGVLK